MGLHELRLQRAALQQRLSFCEHRDEEETKMVFAAGVREQKHLVEHDAWRMSEHEAFQALTIQHRATPIATEHEQAAACAAWDAKCRCLTVRSEDIDKELEHAQAALHSYQASAEEEQSILRVRTETSEAAIWKQTRELEERVVSQQNRERVLNSFEWAAERDECRSEVQSVQQDLHQAVLRANACELTCAGFSGKLQ